MRFVDHAKVVLGEKVEEGEGARTGGASAEVTGIIFNPGAEAHFFHHFEVEFGAHFEALGFEQFALRLEFGEASVEFGADGAQRAAQLVLRGDELFGRKNGQARQGFRDVAGQRVEHADAVDVVAEKFHAHGGLVQVGRMHFDHIAAHPEFAPSEGDVIAFVKQVDKTSEEGFARHILAGFERQEHFSVVLRRAQTVDA